MLNGGITMKRVLQVVLILLVVIIVGTILFFKWVVNANSIVHKSDERKLLLSSSSKKALVIYQPSRTKLTSTMASSIAETLQKSGYEVTINYPSQELNYDISKYDVLVFGTPIYVGKYSTVLESYMKAIKDFSNKRVMIFSTGGDNKVTKEIDPLVQLAKGADKVEGIKLLKGQTTKAADAIKNLTGE
ncbi:flavodoxin [Clostridium autoethanogenum]|uniref:Flavodoxin n=4 Tax=Clostridium TaxID=1485 RepID=A0A3M0T1P8_9CLOT|nr:flavodoxin [Clostridium autoethanogenum]DAD54152.1 TPA_exp: protein of unknown function KV_038 [Clostridium autoethanogenum DSM 10061]